MATPAYPGREGFKSAIGTDGPRVTVMTNLPHGLDVMLDGKRAVFNGRNHRRAIDTDTTEDGRWGVTKGVDKGFWEAFKKTGHPAVVNGNIYAADSEDKAVDMAEETGDAVATGTAPIDADKPGDGVEKADSPGAGE